MCILKSSTFCFLVSFSGTMFTGFTLKYRTVDHSKYFSSLKLIPVFIYSTVTWTERKKKRLQE